MNVRVPTQGTPPERPAEPGVAHHRRNRACNLIEPVGRVPRRCGATAAHRSRLRAAECCRDDTGAEWVAAETPRGTRAGARHFLCLAAYAERTAAGMRRWRFGRSARR